MCGRFSQGGAVRSAFRTYGLTTPAGFRESYNIRPGVITPVIRHGSWIAEMMKWGLIPFWSKEPTVKFSTINARVESVATSAAYRQPFNKRRCLLPVDGFYEWLKVDPKTKFPFFIKLKSRRFFSLACIYDLWKDVSGKELKTYSIITCAANIVIKKIHDRMPCILRQTDEHKYVDPATPISEVFKILAHDQAADTVAYRISTLVNNPENDTLQIQTPINENSNEQTAISKSKLLANNYIKPRQESLI